VLSCVFLFVMWVEGYLGLCVTHTHTRTAHGVLDVSPGVRTRHLEGPKNPEKLKLNFGIFVFVYVYTVHMCVLQYAVRRDEM